jgi:superfamily II DNA helicase RecQ
MLRRMTDYAYHRGCRRAYLLAYFGDSAHGCSGCDVCSGPLDPPPVEELTARRARKRSASAPPIDEGPYDGAVYEALRAMRAALARAEGVPAYVVFSDRSLRAFARSLPETEEAFLAVPGAGPVKWERYGPHVLATIAQARGAATQAAEPRARRAR